MAREGSRATSRHGVTAPASQAGALRAVPAEDMLVDPAELAAVLEERAPGGAVPRRALAIWTVVSLVAAVAAALWWVTAGY